MKASDRDGNIGQANVTVSPSSPDTTAPITIADPLGGNYNATQPVNLTSNEVAVVYYSTDGNTPSVGGANTTSGISPIVVIPIPKGSTILKYFAIDQANNSESIKTGTYVVNISAPTTYSISGAVGGDVLQGVTITLNGPLSSTTTTDALVNYSFSGLSNIEF